jgi:SAM-dependent methyltransferase
MQNKEASVELEQKVKNYYRHVENYDWTRAADHLIGPESFFHRARCREVLRSLRSISPPPVACLDVGCGTAMITRHLPAGTIGLDLNPRNLEKAQEYAPQARFINCDVEGHVPLADASFDLAVCTEMLEHLIRPERAVAEIQRLLKPGGVLIGSVPGRSPIWRLRWLSNSKDSFAEEPYHKHYRRDEVVALLSEHLRVRRLYSKDLQMNWYFVAVKEPAV